MFTLNKIMVTKKNYSEEQFAFVELGIKILSVVRTPYTLMIWSAIYAVFSMKKFDEMSSSVFIMATLRSTCGHYIFVLFLFLSSFFPRLISAVADCMSTILRHMLWS